LLLQWILELDSSTTDNFSRHLLLAAAAAVHCAADQHYSILSYLSRHLLVCMPLLTAAPLLLLCCLFPLQWILELDSSTAEKFSRHLLVRVPGWAFRDNNQVGALVRRICARSEALAQLYLAKDPPKQRQQQGGMQQQQGASAAGGAWARVCFVDGAVYSKNRHFRLLGSCKGGKRAVLQPTQRYAMSAAAR
jgi:hypothetical protein